jgi:DNA-binding CsgD family transcriptional regulator
MSTRSLAEILPTIKPWAREARQHYLGRLQTAAEIYSDDILYPDEFGMLQQPLPDWSVAPVDAPEMLIAAERPLTYEIRRNLDNYTSDRRDVTLSEPGITILAKVALRGEDLSALFQIEAVLERAEINTRQRADQRRRGLELSKREKEVLALYAKYGHLPTQSIAEELGISPVTVSRLISNAAKRNNLDRPRFLEKARATGLIDLSGLPDIDMTVLTHRQRQIVRYALESDEETAARLGVTRETVWRHWHGIFETLGNVSRLQVYCASKRRGGKRIRTDFI